VYCPRGKEFACLVQLTVLVVVTAITKGNHNVMISGNVAIVVQAHFLLPHSKAVKSKGATLGFQTLTSGH
jgi:uncharacterized membrane protein (DUF441 family)